MEEALIAWLLKVLSEPQASQYVPKAIEWLAKSNAYQQQTIGALNEGLLSVIEITSNTHVDVIISQGMTFCGFVIVLTALVYARKRLIRIEQKIDWMCQSAHIPPPN